MNDIQEVIQKKIRQLFPQQTPESVMDILDLYGIEDWEREKERVHLGVLMLSKGSLEELRSCIHTAKQDYRDILSYAEYPTEMSVSATEMLAMSPKDAKAIRDKDRKQYLEWLQNGD